MDNVLEQIERNMDALAEAHFDRKVPEEWLNFRCVRLRKNHIHQCLRQVSCRAGYIIHGIEPEQYRILQCYES